MIFFFNEVKNKGGGRGEQHNILSDSYLLYPPLPKVDSTFSYHFISFFDIAQPMSALKSSNYFIQFFTKKIILSKLNAYIDFFKFNSAVILSKFHRILSEKARTVVYPSITSRSFVST